MHTYSLCEESPLPLYPDHNLHFMAQLLWRSNLPGQVKPDDRENVQEWFLHSSFTPGQESSCWRDRMRWYTIMELFIRVAACYL